LIYSFDSNVVVEIVLEWIDDAVSSASFSTWITILKPDWVYSVVLCRPKSTKNILESKSSSLMA
jgi:hypothetical protein